MITTGKRNTNTGKSFFTKDKYRIGRETHQKGSGKAFGAMTMITHIDKKVIWTISKEAEYPKALDCRLYGIFVARISY